MAYEIIARNKITGKEIYLGGDFETYEEAQWQIDNNIDFEEEDGSPSDWGFEIFDNDWDDYDEPYDLEMGFDPYEGSYTWDC